MSNKTILNRTILNRTILNRTILNLFKSKKGQYYPKPTYSNIHPVLILGIISFCTPFLTPIIHINMPSWLSSSFTFMGVTLILLGAVLSIYKSNN